MPAASRNNVGFIMLFILSYIEFACKGTTFFPDRRTFLDIITYEHLLGKRTVLLS
jgi:hypothetical protein